MWPVRREDARLLGTQRASRSGGFLCESRPTDILQHQEWTGTLQWETLGYGCDVSQHVCSKGLESVAERTEGCSCELC